MLQKKFNYEVIKNGKVIAGMDDKSMAEALAKDYGAKVEESAIAVLTGELSFNSNNLFFTDNEGNTLNDCLAKALGVQFPSGRGASNTLELGYVTITIRQAVDTRPLAGPEE